MKLENSKRGGAKKATFLTWHLPYEQFLNNSTLGSFPFPPPVKILVSTVVLRVIIAKRVRLNDEGV